MEGLHHARRLFCLLAFICGADGLLTRRLQAPCSNSDGLNGYNFSHHGLWIPGYHLVGRGFSKQSCSAECSSLAACVGFSGSFSEDGGNGACYTYTATAGSVPSASDRAYKKCFSGRKETALAAPLAAKATAMHLVGTKTIGQVGTIEDLAKLAEGMEKQLDGISKTMAGADLRMRRLKSMVAGTSAMLTDANRVSSETAKTAVGNRGGLLAIDRSKERINMTFGVIGSSQTRVQELFTRIAERTKGKPVNASSLSALEPNVTAVEKGLNTLNDPAIRKKLDDVMNAYKTFQSGITKEVKAVIRTNLRGLVDTQRDAFRNYTTALQNKTKDPCCTPGCK